jgi:hypothetical protein
MGLSTRRNLMIVLMLLMSLAGACRRSNGGEAHTRSNMVITIQGLALLEEAGVMPPRSIQEYVALREQLPGGFITDGELVDAWGHEFTLEFAPDTSEHELRSAGSDGQFGSADDIVRSRSWTPETVTSQPA